MDRLKAREEAGETKKTLGFEGMTMPEDHPLGRSRSTITRNHWVPTIPGYGGFVPAKDAESCIGGGMTATCRMAGRAIAERRPMADPNAPVQLIPDREATLHFDPELSRDVNGVTAERTRLVNHLRSHCEDKIPGYMGFIPRMKGESIFGAGATAVKKIAADYCEDLAYNPTDHGKQCCAPQFPQPRKLRM